ncbi:SGNH/GDSL hydrolase family protein [Mariniluteicoccus flavus]
MRSKRWPILGLGVLTLLTAGLVVLALLHVRPRETAAVPAAPVTVPSVPGSGPTSTGSATPSGASTPRPRTSEGVRDVMRGDAVDIVVLGDASGMGANGWVAQLADTLASSRKVKLVTVEGDRENATEKGSGARQVTLRNVSDANLTLRGAAGRIDQLVPQGTDLVILSFGHKESQSSISADLEALWTKIPASATAIVTVQNPEKGTAQQAQRDRTRAVTDWANENKAPKVDVFDAFTKAPEPLAELLDKDLVMPNAEGSRLWKDTVVKVLGA